MHKHLPREHPDYERWPGCNLDRSTCDALWTAYLHNHVGEPCLKRIEPQNKLATCSLRKPVWEPPKKVHEDTQ